MPELPDVETYKRYFDRTALHKTVAGVRVGDERILRGISAQSIRRKLKGRRLDSTRRHGKHLLVGLDENGWLTFHFGMTGRFRYFKDADQDPKYDRLRLDFDNGHHLAFECKRMLGRVGMADDADGFIKQRRLGPDALQLDQERFRELMSGRRGSIKAALMDQTLIAGIGNIYSDEMLFLAKINPKLSVNALGDRRLSSLYRAMRKVLQTAIKEGAGSEEFSERLPRSYLLHSRKEGATCPRCGGRIRSTKAAGRTAYYCPDCQGDDRAG
jgi:formamidopyrimidine-DNA glycosylase